MQEPLPAIVVAASRLRAAVEETAAALAGADLDRLVAADAVLQNALGDLPGAATLAAAEQAMLRHEVEEAQAALRRCRLLGAALNDFVRLSMDAQGHGPGYEPRRPAAPAPTGRAFDERV